MAEGKGILVLGEVVEGKLVPIALELLGGGTKLASDLGEEVSMVLLGSGINGLSQEAIAYGADKVYTVDSPLLKDYQTDAYTKAMEKVVSEVTPRILIMGQTSIGRDLAPKLAFRLGVGLAVDCIELSLSDTKSLLATRPVYGGNARAIFEPIGVPQIATVRVKAMSPLPKDEGRKGEVKAIDAGITEDVMRTKVLERGKEEVEGVKLDDADAVVAGGRGIGGPEGFKDLQELAKILKAAVGASRPPCDNGWVPSTWQVGLTGKIISPTLYIAVALSGSSQHMAGCSGSKTIVAINKDPEANIFKEATLGVVGDWKQIIPPFTQKIKELVSG
jgi:electron transfer flavoprotein alpha subunit